MTLQQVHTSYNYRTKMSHKNKALIITVVAYNKSTYRKNIEQIYKF